MREFAALFSELDQSTSTTAKVRALETYFKAAPASDAAWAAFLLAGGRPKRSVSTQLLRTTAQNMAGLSDWLFEECYQAVGDLAETIAHLLPAYEAESDLGLAQWMNDRILPLRNAPAERVEEQLMQFWRELSGSQRLVLNKLLTGGFRVGVSRNLVIRALAQAHHLDSSVVAQRFVGYTDKTMLPTTERFMGLLVAPTQVDEIGVRPFPFFLAQSLKDCPQTLGSYADWAAEWKWDGIRGQLIQGLRQNPSVWSRGEELLSESFPELLDIAQQFPAGTVLDGEILIWDEQLNRPQSFQSLQQRTTRRKVTKQTLKSLPAVFMAYDLLAIRGGDIRARAYRDRRQQLESLVAQLNHPKLKLSEWVQPVAAQAGGIRSWSDLAQVRGKARSLGVEGLMLKRLDSAYGIGRTKSDSRGEWWKWKIDPLTIDAVLIYAQAGHGRRASLYTDYTFAVWDREPGAEETNSTVRRLLPFAKAYSGLTDEEIKKVDAQIRKTTIEKFGPVRSVQPTMVFELGFEGIQRSSRHKSGIAVRFPRILRWRTDKTVDQASTIQELQALLFEPGS